MSLKYEVAPFLVQPLKKNKHSFPILYYHIQLSFQNFFVYIFLTFFIFYAQKLHGNVMLKDSTLESNSSSIRSSYNKTLNIHTFTNQIGLRHSIKNLELVVGNNLTSAITEASIKNIRDENKFNFTFTYKLNPILKTGLGIESRLMKDDRKIEINRFKDNAYNIISIISPNENLIVTPFVGFKMEEQVEKKETGLNYGLDSKLKNFKFDNFVLKGFFKLNNNNLTIRRNRYLASEFLLDGNFSSSIYSNTMIKFNRNIRDYYFQIDSATARLFNIDYNLEQRKDNLLELNQNILSIKLINYYDFELNSNIYYREVDKNVLYKNYNQPSKNTFDTRIEEFRLAFNIQSKFTFNGYSTITKLSYYERSEKHNVKRISNIDEFFYYQRLDEELQKNNFSSRIILSSNNQIEISRKDSVFIDLTFSKLQYNTPPISNYTNPQFITRNDRDELMYLIKLQYKKVFNPFFIWNTILESYNNHFVYIFGERSSNNNWNRVIRLNTSSLYEQTKFKTFNQFEVLANYTIYDFEDVVRTERSFAFRQFSFYDSSRIYLRPNLYFSTFYSLRLSEQGSLNWKSFSIAPQRYLEENLIESKLNMNLTRFSEISFGFRMTSFKEYYYQNRNKTVTNSIESLGPLLEANLFWKENAYLITRIWIEYIKQGKINTRRNINLSFSSFINF